MIDRITTARLVLRVWRDEDLAPFAAMNADPEVMAHFPRALSKDESDALAARIRTSMQERGFGLWAVEEKDGAPFVGFVGLWVPTFEARFTPCVEMGWRIARPQWGNGFASEAARRVIEVAFGELRLSELLAWTSVENVRSRRVMRAIGMRHHPEDDFDHPEIPEGHRLRRHVVYRTRNG